MKKKILCLAMAAIMVVGTSMTAYAKEYQGKDGWLVDFDGKNMNSNFESKDLTEEASAIQPGDGLELKVQLKNGSSDKTDWYMTNEVIESLEDAKKQASGGAYEYKLTFVNSAGTEKVLYNSETVGGEGSTQGGEGLHQATDSLEGYFYLDRLEAGKTGMVHLWIRVDGETQGNGYQQTLAKLQMNFAVEKVAAGTTTRQEDRVITKTKFVKTGDTTNLLMLSVMALVSGVVLLIFGVHYLKKRNHSRRKGE